MKKNIIIISAFSACVIMILFPEVTAASSKEAINLWLNSIIPTLLPFFFFTEFIKNIGFSDRIRPDVYPFIMAAMSGYPMGAGITGNYCRAGLISTNRMYHILSYSMVTGPVFIIGTVGTEFLDSYRLGIVLAASHYLGAFFNSFLYRDNVSDSRIQPVQKFKSSGNYYNMLTDAILESFKAMAVILAYIIIFMIITDIFQFSGLLTLITQFLPEEYRMVAEAFLKGIIEMTVGTSSLGYIKEMTVLKTVLASFIVSFGGLSVSGQTLSMLKNCNAKIHNILIIKITHGIISAFLTYIILFFLYFNKNFVL